MLALRTLPRTPSNRSREAAHPELFPQELSTGLVHLLEPLSRLRVRAPPISCARLSAADTVGREDTTRASEDTLSILVRYSPPSLTFEQYEEADRLLREVGIEPLPDGLEYHVCFGPEGNLRVSEIWDSREQFEAYGKRLMEMPVFADIPFDSGGPPEILEVHKIRKR